MFQSHKYSTELFYLVKLSILNKSGYKCSKGALISEESYAKCGCYTGFTGIIAKTSYTGFSLMDAMPVKPFSKQIKYKKQVIFNCK